MSFLHTEVLFGPQVPHPSLSGTGFNGLKEELVSLGNPPTPWIDNMSQPVNNFLKDPLEMEKEFRKEVDTDTVSFRSRTLGKIIPIDEALKGCMEQNY